MGGGHLHWKVVPRCAFLKPPLFLGHILSPETHHFKPFSSSRDPHFHFLSSIQDQFFADFLAPETQILIKFVSKTPVSSKNKKTKTHTQKKNTHTHTPTQTHTHTHTISSRDPIFENLGGTSTQIFVD